MPDRYQKLLDTAYVSFLAMCAHYPATGHNQKPMFEDGQKQQIENLVNIGAASLSTTLGMCGQVLTRGAAGQYLSKATFQSDGQKHLRLLEARVKALTDVFTSFERKDDEWVRKGAMLSHGARKKAVAAQRTAVSKFLTAIAAIEGNVERDFDAILAHWPGDNAPSPPPFPAPQPTPTPSPTPAPAPTPQPTPTPPPTPAPAPTPAPPPTPAPTPSPAPAPGTADAAAQRQALLDAASSGAPCVGIDPALKAKT